jgi:hypothetical protein
MHEQAAAMVEPAEQVLAVAVGVGEAMTLQVATQRAVGALEHPGVLHLGVLDLPVERSAVDGAFEDLDIGKLWHRAAPSS